MIIITGTPNIIAISLLLYSRHYNMAVTRIHEKYAHVSNYSLAARFQAKENIKCFDMIGKVLIAGFFIVLIGFVVAIALFLNIFPQVDTLWNICLLSVMSLSPIVICPAIIYSVDSFRSYPFLRIDHIWDKMKKRRRKVGLPGRKTSSARSDVIRKETETYFNQLAASWT
uniref:MMPL domain-containing protein n=1 Tax=Caenorhabditis tropicalis TaxID=1561998 RepID=A0A1I7UUI8_9PELO